MNKTATMLMTTLAFGALPFAQANDFDDYARVISATPQVEQINRPRQECRTEYVQVERQVQNTAPSSNRGNAGAIIGGVAGAILGNQVGNGNGRVVATAAGAIAGAMVGDRLENTGNTTNTAHVPSSTYTTTSEQPVRNCRTIDHWETRTNGYSVTYEYHGRTYKTVTSNDPGRRMKVRVSVAPADVY